MEQIILNETINKIQQNQDVALVTIIQTTGSSPRGIGSMMLVNVDGRLLEGTIGGGAIEEKAKSDAAACIRRGKSQLIHYDLHPKGTNNPIGMVCGGCVDVFIKVFKTLDELLIVGAGHIGYKLSKMAKLLGYEVTIVDDREAFVSKERFEEADHLKCGDIEEILKNHPIHHNTNIVIVTHGHKHDLKALETVLDFKARYIGMIGSMNKIKTCFKSLLQKGVEKEKLEKIYTPIGVDLGGETPEEIALCIMAEIQAVKHNKPMNFLKDKKGSEIYVYE